MLCADARDVPDACELCGVEELLTYKSAIVPEALWLTAQAALLQHALGAGGCAHGGCGSGSASAPAPPCSNAVRAAPETAAAAAAASAAAASSAAAGTAAAGTAAAAAAAGTAATAASAAGIAAAVGSDSARCIKVHMCVSCHGHWRQTGTLMTPEQIDELACKRALAATRQLDAVGKYDRCGTASTDQWYHVVWSTGSRGVVQAVPAIL